MNIHHWTGGGPRVRPERLGQVRAAGAAPSDARPLGGGAGHPDLAPLPVPGHVCQCDGAVQTQSQGGHGRAEGEVRLHQVRGHRQTRGAIRGRQDQRVRPGDGPLEARGDGVAQ